MQYEVAGGAGLVPRASVAALQAFLAEGEPPGPGPEPEPEARQSFFVANCRVSTLDGGGAAASVDAVAMTPNGTIALLVDSEANTVRWIDMASGDVSAFVGGGARGDADGGKGEASFHSPQDAALTADGTLAFIADTGNNKVRRVVVATGEVSTLAGGGVQVGRRSRRHRQLSIAVR
jgi:DNA-binding beta-propeller fold protein YncE